MVIQKEIRITFIEDLVKVEADYNDGQTTISVATSFSLVDGKTLTSAELQEVAAKTAIDLLQQSLQPQQYFGGR
jgi:hypothetical protein